MILKEEILLANNGTSVLDYIITSSNIFDKTDQFYVANFDASDHLPVCCTLKFTKKHPAIEHSIYKMGYMSGRNTHGCLSFKIRF